MNRIALCLLFAAIGCDRSPPRFADHAALRVRAEGDALALEWPAAIEDEVETYVVYEDEVAIGESTERRFIVQGGAIYAVRPRDLAGNLGEPLSLNVAARESEEVEPESAPVEVGTEALPVRLDVPNGLPDLRHTGEVARDGIPGLEIGTP